MNREGVAFAMLVLFILRSRVPTRASAGERSPEPELPGLPLALRADPLPDDVVAAAREAWISGERAAALSLLYRGALVHLIGATSLVLPESATESECVRAVRRAANAVTADDFAVLTRAWQYCAYAGEAPSEAGFEQLCDSWSRHLRGSA